MLFSKNAATVNESIVFYIGGSRGRAWHTYPLQDPILLFSHTFSLKSACFGGRRPPNGSMPPPLRKILDPPLFYHSLCLISLKLVAILLETRKVYYFFAQTLHCCLEIRCFIDSALPIVHNIDI